MQGFFSFDSSVLPGNYGLMDQLQAIKWVKDNIADFGGDPNRITLAGDSTGMAAREFYHRDCII